MNCSGKPQELAEEQFIKGLNNRKDGNALEVIDRDLIVAAEVLMSEYLSA